MPQNLFILLIMGKFDRKYNIFEFHNRTSLTTFKTMPRLRGFACETHTRDLKSHTRDLRFQNLTRESHARDLIVFLWYPTSVTRDFRNQDVARTSKKILNYDPISLDLATFPLSLQHCLPRTIFRISIAIFRQ